MRCQLEQASHLSYAAPLLLLCLTCDAPHVCRAKNGLAQCDNVLVTVVERPLLIAAYYCEFRHTAAKVMSGAGGLSRRACGQGCRVELVCPSKKPVLHYIADRLLSMCQ